ncbi:helix-turn-helix transcriptional regulator [Bacteroides sp. KFT8]|uniref:S24 family peptidase n=1 Tax=Bacteroides sp. KFT8 TaxID=2025659 RepID=UPI0021003850|nr:S24 family peptidase [Bacteroides sp. KFT8]
MDKDKAIKVFNELLKELRMNPKQLSDSLGKERPQWAYDILNENKNVGISKNAAKLICSKYPQINESWLLTGEGEMLIGENTASQDKTSEQAESSANTSQETDEQPKVNFTIGVPYYNIDFICGFDLVLNDQTTKPEYLIDFRKYNDATCWCNVTGHSMEPEINHGDIIALKKIEDPSFLPLGEVYAIVTTNDMRTIKRLGKGDDKEHYNLIPTNKSPEYGVQEIPKKMIRTIFQVLGCMKRL